LPPFPFPAGKSLLTNVNTFYICMALFLFPGPALGLGLVIGGGARRRFQKTGAIA
jgi:hypothetical protein